MSAYIFLFLRLAIILALFTFLGYALWFLYKDVNQRGKRLVKTSIPPITFLLRNREESEPIRFANPNIVIGREPACDLRLGETTLSSRHAQVSFHHGQWWVKDLNSTNGTYLNDEPVITPLVLVSNDQLRCGEVLLGVSIEEESSND